MLQCVLQYALQYVLQCVLQYVLRRPHTATLNNCNTLQHNATHCNTLQHTAKHVTNPGKEMERLPSAMPARACLGKEEDGVELPSHDDDLDDLPVCHVLQSVVAVCCCSVLQNVASFAFRS